MQFNLVNNEEQALYLSILLFSVALSFSVVVTLSCFPWCLYAYLQCVHSASMVAGVGSLATVSGLPIACAARL